MLVDLVQGVFGRGLVCFWTGQVLDQVQGIKVDLVHVPSQVGLCSVAGPQKSAGLRRQNAQKADLCRRLAKK